jgi:hypothetical protein
MALGYWRVDGSASREKHFAELTPHRPRLRYAPLVPVLKGVGQGSYERKLRHDR